MRIIRLLLVLSLSLAGTGGTMAKAQEDSTPSTPARNDNYRLRPRDLIRIQIYQEPELDRELRISQDYTLVLPLIGIVNVKGRSVRETELLITRFYEADYLVNPQLNITVLEYAPQTVNVLGAVNSPGAVPIMPEKGLFLLDAIARSGGFSRLANRTRISLTRTYPDGTTQNFIVNADDLVVGNTVETTSLQDGDVVSVPERML